MEPIAILTRFQQALPVRPFAGALLLRAALLWVLVRVTFAVFGVQLTYASERPSLVTVVGIIALTAALGLIDLRRRGERVLLANLGIGPAGLTTPLLAPPVLFEIMTALITR